jgi:hypothetical protein
MIRAPPCPVTASIPSVPASRHQVRGVVPLSSFFREASPYSPFPLLPSPLPFLALPLPLLSERPWLTAPLLLQIVNSPDTGVRLFMTSTVGRMYLVHLCPTGMSSPSHHLFIYRASIDLPLQLRVRVGPHHWLDASTRSIYLGCALRRVWREDWERVSPRWR